MKNLIVLLFLVFSVASFAEGVSYHSNPSIYVSTEEGIDWPKDYRIYWKEVEFGLFPKAIGITKLFPVQNYYAELGAGYVTTSGDLGIIGTVGYHKTFFAGLGFRADWATVASLTGYQHTAVTIGLTYTF